MLSVGRPRKHGHEQQSRGVLEGRYFPQLGLRVCSLKLIGLGHDSAAGLREQTLQGRNSITGRAESKTLLHSLLPRDAVLGGPGLVALSREAIEDRLLQLHRSLRSGDIADMDIRMHRESRTYLGIRWQL